MAQKSLAEQFRFDASTPILKLLPSLLLVLEARLRSVETIASEVDSSLSSLEAVALQRLNEVFTPLIVAAQSRLENFGAAFNATSATSLVVGDGIKIVQIDEVDREGFVFSDYVAVRATSDLTKSMIGQVQDYNRASGQLTINVVTHEGSGTFASWQVRFTSAPDLAHAGRTDNPHSTTAAQVGAYSEAETDIAIAAAIAIAVDVINTSIAGFGFMRQSLNLADLIDKAAARVNLNAAFALGGYTALNKAGDTMTGAFTCNSHVTAVGELKSSSSIVRLSADNTRYLFWTGAAYVLGGAGNIWHTGNLNPMSIGGNNSLLNNDSGYITAAYVNSRPISQFSNDVGYMAANNAVSTGAIDNGGGIYYFLHNAGISISYNGTFGRIDCSLSFNAAGNLSCGGAKLFDIPHPTKEAFRLRHAAIEAPESAVAYRGKGTISNDGSVRVDLPDYVLGLFKPDSATIHLQRIVVGGHLSTDAPPEASEFEGRSFTVYGTPGTLFHWRLEAERVNADFVVEEEALVHEPPTPILPSLINKEAL